MSSIDELRALLDERGVDYRVSATGYSIDIGPYTTAYANRSDTTLDVSLRQVTPEQAIAATLGDSDATGARRGDARKVYLVEACDELIEGWCPLGVYLSREAAGRHAESLRGEVDGVMSFARVVEMEVLG